MKSEQRIPQLLAVKQPKGLSKLIQIQNVQFACKPILNKRMNTKF